MKNTKLILIIFIVSFSVSFSQNFEQNKIVARIGDETINENEFIERYEFNPMFRKNIKRMSPSLKLEFLYTLIAEKLWAQNARSNYLDTTLSYRTAFTSLEKLFVRDALYKKEITDKVVVSEKEIDRGIKELRKLYSVRYIISDDSSKIQSIYGLLNKGVPFDSVLTSRKEFEEQPSPAEVTFGDLQEYVEDIVFKLKPNHYTAPIWAPDGWYIFNLYGIAQNTGEMKSKYEDLHKKSEKIVRSRKAAVLYKNFFIGFFNNKKVSADSRLFGILSGKIASVMAAKIPGNNESKQKLFNLAPEDINRIENEISAKDLNSAFIRIPGDPVSLRQFLREIFFNGFETESNDSTEVIQYFNQRVRKFIEDELLTREGYRQNLQHSEEVRHDMKIWSDYYLAQEEKSKIIESIDVPDSTARRIYDSRFKPENIPTQVNIIEVLTKDIETAQKVVAEARNGADFHELARKYSIREWTKKSNGEFGFFPTTSFGEIGKIAAGMEIGDYYGPLKTAEGYSIFKLIDKKKREIVAPSESFDEIKDRLKREIAAGFLKESMTKHVADLASKLGVKIYPDVLNSIQVTDLNSFAIRYIGFGGKITAVPMVAPDNDWVDIWLKNKNVLP